MLSLVEYINIYSDQHSLNSLDGILKYAVKRYLRKMSLNLVYTAISCVFNASIHDPVHDIVTYGDCNNNILVVAVEYIGLLIVDTR